MIALLFISISFWACSSDTEGESEKGAIKEMTDQVAKDIVHFQSYQPLPISLSLVRRGIKGWGRKFNFGNRVKRIRIILTQLKIWDNQFIIWCDRS